MFHCSPVFLKVATQTVTTYLPLNFCLISYIPWHKPSYQQTSPHLLGSWGVSLPNASFCSEGVALGLQLHISKLLRTLVFTKLSLCSKSIPKKSTQVLCVESLLQHLFSLVIRTMLLAAKMMSLTQTSVTTILLQTV